MSLLRPLSCFAAALVVLTAVAHADFDVIKGPVDVETKFPASIDYEVSLDPSTGLPSGALGTGGAGNDWTGVRELRIELSLPDDVPRGTTCAFYLKDFQWKWYQFQPEGSLGSGRTNLVRIDMRPGAQSWVPRGHNRMWDGYVAHRLSAFGIKVFNTKPWSGRIRIESVRALTGETHLAPPAVTDLTVNATEVPRFEKYEMSFDLTRVYENPFDPDEIDVRAVFTAPSKKTREQFGFHTRDYVRRQSPLGYERLVGVGRGSWKVRWTPDEEGLWTVQLTLWDKHAEAAWKAAVAAEGVRAKSENQKPAPPARDGFLVKLAPITFTCTPSKHHGFIRVDPKDPLYFAYSDGTFYYPIGQMLRSPFDLRPAYDGYKTKANPGEGTYAYDRMMKRLSENGVNLIRVWMGMWWLGLEAPAAYAPGYEGLGRYNMENAWKLDYILEEARRLQIKVKLNLNNHGQLSRHVDQEFYENCYNAMLGGPLKSPSEFWTSAEAKKRMKTRFRYITARWAYSPQIMSWELFNEVDLTEDYDPQNVRNWHKEFAAYLTTIDPWKHPVSTHFYNHEQATGVYSLPEMAYVSGDLYVPNIAMAMRNRWLEKKGFNKPVYISEFGKASTEKQLEVQFHGGLWSSTILPMPGTAMLWWSNWVDDRNLYYHYRAIDRFNRDSQTGLIEDRRNKDWQLTSAQIRRGEERHDVLSVLGRQNGAEAHLWVYDTQIFNNNDGNRYADAPSFVGCVLVVKGLAAGDYRVQFYDTTTGDIAETTTVKHTGGDLRLPLLKVQIDLAVKIKQTGK